MIDTDHYLDYLAFERQWRRPGPASFLRYYFTNKIERAVLPLHSLELMIALGAFAFMVPHPLLLGYLAGASMHLTFDILVNGDYVLRRRVLFYSFVYRASHQFSAPKLMDRIEIPTEAGAHPFREFFRWRPLGIRPPIPQLGWRNWRRGVGSRQ